MIKISGCLFWLQSMLFKSSFSDEADFPRKEGGDITSPRFAILITPLLPHVAKNHVADTPLYSTASVSVPALRSKNSKCTS